MIEITSEAIFQQVLKKHLVFVDFHATWCNPCRALAPWLKDVEAHNPFRSVCFVKVDVDKMDSIAERFKITAMPTMVLLRDGKEVARIVGVDKEKIVKTLEKYVTS